MRKRRPMKAAAPCREYAEGESNLKEGAELRQRIFGCSVARQLDLGFSEGADKPTRGLSELYQRPDESESPVAVRSSEPTIERQGGWA